MANKLWLQAQEFLKDPKYWKEAAILDFTDELGRRMKEQGINKAELARRIGKSSPYITKVFQGNTNLTLKSMAKLALAVDARVNIHLSDKDSITSWTDITVEEAQAVEPSLLHRKPPMDAPSIHVFRHNADERVAI